MSVKPCPEALSSESACPHELLGCGCYGSGYADGKNKALFEVEVYDLRNLAHDNSDLGLAVKALLRSVEQDKEMPLKLWE